MMRWIVILSLTLTWRAAVAAEKTYDFEFKDMDVGKAVQSLSQMLGKNVVLPKAMDAKPFTLTLRQVTPETALRAILDSQGFMLSPRRGMYYVVPATGNDAKTGAQDAVIIPLVNVIAKDIETNIRAVVGAGAVISINEQRNAFIVNGTEETIEQIKRLVAELDQEVTQIFIEAKLIETSNKFSRQFGVEWGQAGMRGGAGQQTGANAGGTGTDSTGSGVGNVNVNQNGVSMSGFDRNAPLIAKMSTGLSSAAIIEAKLLAAEANGEAKIISSPRISTLNGTPATIESLTTVTFKTLVGTNAGVTNQGTTEKIRTGLKFTVTPFLVSDEQVRLNVTVSKSFPSATGPDQLPTVDDSTAATSLIVRDGETASIGGMVLQTAIEGSQGVPFLSSLPVVGALFGSLSKTKENKELLIFMTPTIFRTSRSAWSGSSRSEKLSTVKGDPLERLQQLSFSTSQD